MCGESRRRNRRQAAQYNAWPRPGEFDPLTASVPQLVEWTEVHGRTKRRFRHYAGAMYLMLASNQRDKAKELATYMNAAIHPGERAEDFAVIMREAQAAGDAQQAEVYRLFALQTNVIDFTSYCALLLAGHFA